MEQSKTLHLTASMNTNQINSLVLAYLGDSIYELYVRSYLIKKGINKVNDLQNEAKNFVSAKSQCKFLTSMLENDFLTEEEKTVIMRERNHKVSRHPKNTDLMTYKYSTGFEALIGYLHLEGQNDRIKEIMKEVIGEEICIYVEKM